MKYRFVIILLSILILSSCEFSQKRYKPDWDKWKNYKWILNKNVRNNINSGFTLYKKNANFNLIRYNENNQLVIWEFKHHNYVSIDSINFFENIDLSNFILYPGQTFNKEDILETSVRINSDLDIDLHLNLNSDSKIYEYINKDKVKGIIGKVSQMSLSDETGYHQVLFDFPIRSYNVATLFFKRDDSFFILILFPDDGLVKDKLKDLNLPELNE
ncbi:hypothetical protein [Marinifilum flexuosum]|uniref:Lipoprotein n=1 Tax=Marinifilum flexuosum TaxID=1117708 RepID=A0A419X6F9_9BACT|nr:hypothetical protein [Marinifilum flexuosum]RKE03328.1 hypothetical protein BXY64_0321 [Marinifilum flexuosum]